MYKLKDYIKSIRYSVILDNIMYFYFIRTIVLILINKNISSWICVSIPIIIEISKLLSRTINKLLILSIKISFKLYHFIYITSFSIISIIICIINNYYLIFILSFILGLLTGVRRSSILNFNSSNKKYETSLFIEEEKSQVCGSFIGLVLGQYLYDTNFLYYLIFYIVIIIIELFIQKYIKNIIIKNNHFKVKKINKNSKNILIKKSILFAFIVSFWHIGLYSFEELAPLISKKIGYINSIYTLLEFILLILLSKKFISKISKKNNLLILIIISLTDIIASFITSYLLNVYGLVISYIISSIVSTLGEPIYESIISSLSNNNKNKYILVNKIIYITRTIFTIISFIICKFIIINDIIYFRYLSIILFILINITYLIINKFYSYKV